MATSLENATMFCQKCGTKGRGDSYCTRCGEWLAAAKKYGQPVSPERQASTILIMSGLGAAIALVNAVILYAAYFGWLTAKFAIPFAAAFLLALTTYQAATFMLGMKLRQRMKRGREDSQASSNAATDQFEARSFTSPKDATYVAQLPASDAAVTPALQVSITESTTELLPNHFTKSESRHNQG